MAWNITVSSLQSLLESSWHYFLLFFLHWNIVTQTLICLHSYIHLLLPSYCMCLWSWMPAFVAITPNFYPRNTAGWPLVNSKTTGDVGQTLFYLVVWKADFMGQKLFGCVTKNSPRKRLALKLRWCNRETTTATAEKVNLYIMLTSLHSNILSVISCNMLHRACKPVCIWWNLMVTADRELIVKDFYMHMQVCLGLLWSELTLKFSLPWLNGIAADIGSTPISTP